MLRLRVFRFQEGKERRYDTFQVEERDGMTVLEALFKIQEELDPTLSFRYSCRGAVCGSCAMLINKIPRLACRTQVKDVKARLIAPLQALGPFAKPALAGIERGEILVEPLPNLPPIKDLVVDMQPFFKRYESLKPWLIAREPLGEKEHLMTPEEVRKLEPYVNCILCAACYASCPAYQRDKNFLGPAALAKAYRFAADPRNAGEFLERVDSHEGVWGCDAVFRCAEVCPKQVPPTQAITALRRRIFKRRLRIKR